MLMPSSSQCVEKRGELYNVSSRGPSGQPSGTVAPKWTSTKPTTGHKLQKIKITHTN